MLLREQSKARQMFVDKLHSVFSPVEFALNADGRHAKYTGSNNLKTNSEDELFYLFWLDHGIFIMQGMDCQENLFITEVSKIRFVLSEGFWQKR